MASRRSVTKSPTTFATARPLHGDGAFSRLRCKASSRRAIIATSRRTRSAIWPSVSMCLNVLFSIRWFFSENKNGPGLGWSRAVHPLLPRSRLFTSGVKRDAPRNPSGFFRLGLVSLRHSFDRNGRLFPPQINTRMAGGRPLGDGVLFTQPFRQAGFSKLKNTRKPCVMPFCSAAVRSTPPKSRHVQCTCACPLWANSGHHAPSFAHVGSYSSDDMESKPLIGQ